MWWRLYRTYIVSLHNTYVALSAEKWEQPSPASLQVDYMQDRWSEGAVQCFPTCKARMACACDGMCAMAPCLITASEEVWH